VNVGRDSKFQGTRWGTYVKGENVRGLGLLQKNAPTLSMLNKLHTRKGRGRKEHN